MNAFHQILDPHATAIRALPWADRVTLARINSVHAPDYIASIRDEAVVLMAGRYAAYGEHKAVADACEAFLATVDDDGGEDELDELDALLVDEEPEPDWPTARERNSMGMCAGLVWEARHGG